MIAQEAVFLNVVVLIPSLLLFFSGTLMLVYQAFGKRKKEKEVVATPFRFLKDVFVKQVCQEQLLRQRLQRTWPQV